MRKKTFKNQKAENLSRNLHLHKTNYYSDGYVQRLTIVMTMSFSFKHGKEAIGPHKSTEDILLPKYLIINSKRLIKLKSHQPR